MEGVTILSTGTAMLGMPWIWAIIFALIVFVVIYALNPFGDDDFGWRIGLATFVSLFGFAILALFVVDTTEVAEYKVTIDDSVKYVEFMEKYEVIDQEGKIYTVRERTE